MESALDGSRGDASAEGELVCNERESRMNHAVVVFVVVGIAAIVAIAGYLYSHQRRSRLLREHFGPEYDRVLGQEKSVRRAEGVLEFREKAREAFRIRPLSRTDQNAYAELWNSIQRKFVDAPADCVVQADRLVSEVMEARGYPLANFEQRAEIVSVDHPVVVQNYRAAHDIAQRQNGAGQVTTEDLRKAMVHYRSLFDELLRDSTPAKKEARG